MTEKIHRRRFVASIGTAGIIGAAGCIGGGQPQSGDSEVSTESGDDEQTSDPESDETFEFPLGANANGVVIETLLAGAREFLTKSGRYRITQEHDIDHTDAGTDSIDATYDVAEGTVHEDTILNGVAIERWITPDRTIARSVASETDQRDMWRTDTVDPTGDTNHPFVTYPLDDTTVPSVLESASFEFDEIVSVEETPYAKYSGTLESAEQLDLRRWRSARIYRRLESLEGGHVSMLLGESGAIHSVEYEYEATVDRLTRHGREATSTNVTGRVDFEYADLEPLASPSWTKESDSNDTREFAVKDRSHGSVYELTRGPPLPGASELEYTNFYVTAHFGDDVYVGWHTQQTDFENGDRLYARLDDEFDLTWRSTSGQNALEKADRIELSVFLRHPSLGRRLVFYDEYYP